MKDNNVKTKKPKKKYNELIEKIGKLSCGGNSVEDIRLERSRIKNPLQFAE